MQRTREGRKLVTEKKSVQGIGISRREVNDKILDKDVIFLDEHNIVTERDFPGGPLVKTPRFYWRGQGFIPKTGKFHVLCGWQKKKKKNVTDRK